MPQRASHVPAMCSSMCQPSWPGRCRLRGPGINHQEDASTPCCICNMHASKSTFAKPLQGVPGTGQHSTHLQQIAAGGLRTCCTAECKVQQLHTVHRPYSAAGSSVVGNGKRRPLFPFPRRKRPFPCGNGTAVSMWKRDVPRRQGRQAGTDSVGGLTIAITAYS
eukprot:349811-Chlamydomonas_euryale.AAC.2